VDFHHLLLTGLPAHSGCDPSRRFAAIAELTVAADVSKGNKKDSPRPITEVTAPKKCFRSYACYRIF
jgi:hypothetical protein